TGRGRHRVLARFGHGLRRPRKTAGVNSGERAGADFQPAEQSGFQPLEFRLGHRTWAVGPGWYGAGLWPFLPAPTTRLITTCGNAPGPELPYRKGLKARIICSLRTVLNTRPSKHERFTHAKHVHAIEGREGAVFETLGTCGRARDHFGSPPARFGILSFA